MPRARPGLPRCGKQVAVGRAGECRTRRLLLVFRRVRCRRHGLEFQHVVACSGGRESPGPRSSVALPLGINGGTARGGKGWDYPTLLDGRSQRGPNEHREVAALRRGWLRPARPVGSQELGLFLLGSSSGAPPGARLRRSLRAEDGDSSRNRAIRS